MKTDNSYYNTTHRSGVMLRIYEAKAVAQEVRLLDFFHDNPDRIFTRSELHKIIMQECPVSSITRALANLKKKGDLIRTEIMRDGEFNRPMHCWKLSTSMAPLTEQRDLLTIGGERVVF